MSDTNFDMDIWRLANGSGLVKKAGGQISYSYSNPGVYEVQLRPREQRIPNQPYCHDSFANKIITVLGIRADFSIDNQEPIYHFKNLSNPLKAHWQWEFGHTGSTNDSANSQDASHNYGKDKGRYQVCLKATLPFGCEDKVCKWIENNYSESIKTYNVFTPGVVDGMNDEFDIEIEGESKYQLVIYNRYGVAVFKGEVDGENGQGINWNGRVNNSGAQCASGTYYYTLNYSYKRIPEKEFEVNGVITLLR